MFQSLHHGLGGPPQALPQPPFSLNYHFQSLSCALATPRVLSGLVSRTSSALACHSIAGRLIPGALWRMEHPPEEVHSLVESLCGAFPWAFPPQ